MYCTGGIRCEKASIQMENLGYSEVYQLYGGILRYLEQFPHQTFKLDCTIQIRAQDPIPSSIFATSQASHRFHTEIWDPRHPSRNLCTCSPQLCFTNLTSLSRLELTLSSRPLLAEYL